MSSTQLIEQPARELAGRLDGDPVGDRHRGVGDLHADRPRPPGAPTSPRSRRRCRARRRRPGPRPARGRGRPRAARARACPDRRRRRRRRTGARRPARPRAPAAGAARRSPRPSRRRGARWRPARAQPSILAIGASAGMNTSQRHAARPRGGGERPARGCRRCRRRPRRRSRRRARRACARAAQLERARPLEVLGLQRDGAAAAIRQQLGVQQRRMAHDVADGEASTLDIRGDDTHGGRSQPSCGPPTNPSSRSARHRGGRRTELDQRPARGRAASTRRRSRPQR